MVYLAVKPWPEDLANTNGLSPGEARAEVGRVRTALLASLAGLIAATGAVLSGLTYRLNSRVAAQTHERDLQSQITERFTRAIDQLGNRSSLDVRLGGIYALERIARDSVDDQPQVVEVLTAFVRQHSPADPEAQKSGDDRESPATDVQAVLTVIGRRNVERNGSRATLDLSSTRLCGANLRGARLDDALLVGAQLDYADLTGARLREANLAGARLSNAVLKDADLGHARLMKAQLDYAEMVGADLSSANLIKAYLEGAEMCEATLDNASLDRAHLQHADLADAELEHAELTGAHLEAANLTGAHFDHANLKDGHLERADLSSAHFDAADMRGVQMQNAKLHRVDLTGAQLAGANLSSATGSIAAIRLHGATYDDETNPPHPDFDWEAYGAVHLHRPRA